MYVVLRGRKDPVWWIETILLDAPMFPKQREILYEFYRDKYNPGAEHYRNLYICGGMRGGKTALGGMIAAYEFFYALTAPGKNPAEYYGLLKNQLVSITVQATSEKQIADGVYYNIRNFLENCEWINKHFDLIYKADEIYCPDKFVRVRAVSSSAQTGVGRSNILYLADELANFEESEGKRGAWSVFTRMKNSTDTFGKDGRCVAISSPKRPTDIIMTLVARSKYEDRSLGLTIPSWEMNPTLDEEELKEEHRFNIAEFLRDFACLPSAAGGMEFPEGVILKPITNVLMGIEPTSVKKPPRDGRVRVCAIDPAVTNDGFGIGVGYKGPDGNLTIDGIRKFRKKEGDPFIKPSEIQAYIDRVVRELNVSILLFDTWMYPALIEHVQNDLGVSVEKHIVDKSNYDRWRELQSANKITVVYDEELEMEANQLEVKELARGAKVDHPAKGSKDMADCVANIVWFLEEGTPVSQKLNLAIYRTF